MELRNYGRILAALALAACAFGQQAAVTEVAVSYSATPTFTANAAVTNFTITLTGNVTSSTFSSPAVGVGSLRVCQDATGGRTFTAPAGSIGFGAIDATASKCSTATWKWDGSTLRATSAFTKDSGAVVEGGSVASVFGRTGAIAAQSGDYSSYYPLLTNNLSDLPNAGTARTNLGLGNSATRSVGTTTGTVAAGDDSRLSDSRTPTAHASTHANAGSDPVTLAESQITGLVSDLAGKAPTANPTFTGNVTIGGTVLRGGGTSLPATCSVGDQYFLTTGTTGLYSCTATNTWTLPSGGGGSGTVNSGTAGQLAYYSANGAAVSGTSTVPTNAEYNIGTCTTAATINPTNGNRQKVTLTNAQTCALTFTQPSSGTVSVQLKIIQSSAGSFNGTISGGLWPGGSVPTITATSGAVDVATCYLDGTNAYCVATQDFR